MSGQIYIALQLMTGFAYLYLSWQQFKKPGAIVGTANHIYLAFILFCSFHHFGCVTMIFDEMPGHIDMMYGLSGWPLFRLVVDFGMTFFKDNISIFSVIPFVLESSEEK